MYAIALLQGMVFYGAIATLYRQAVGVSVFQITIIESISLALALALELPCGILAEKIGYKNTMIFSCLIYFISKLVFWQANGFGMFLMERIMLSFVMAGMSGVDASILYLSSKKEDAHKVFGIYSSLQTVGLMLASAIYSVFMHGNYRMAALATVIAYGVATVLVFFIQEVRSAESKTEPLVSEFLYILKDTWKRKELFLFLIGIALFSECHQTITVFLNQLQYMRAGMTNQSIGWAYVVMTAAGLLGVKSASIAKRIGKRKAGILFFAIAIVSCLIITITEISWLSVLAVILLRVTFSMMMPLVQTIQNEQVTHKNRATALSINAVIMDGVAISTNLILGKATDISLPLAFQICVSFCVVGMLLFFYSTGKMKKRYL